MMFGRISRQAWFDIAALFVACALAFVIGWAIIFTAANGGT